MKQYRALLGPLLVVALFLVAMRWSPFEPHRPPADDPAMVADGEGDPAAATLDSDAQPTWADADWTSFEATVHAALEQRLDTLPIGSRMAGLGRMLVGTPYVPKTLEVEGPEAVVINFRGLDCVTFVENVWALAWFVRVFGPTLAARPVALGEDRGAYEGVYARMLRDIRYRDGEVGYGTRLHYFSDWIAHHDSRGGLIDLTEGLGGAFDGERVDFMTTHTEAYRQLADPALVEELRVVEERLGAAGRWYIPQDRIAGIADRIQNGDVIAATSTVEGLDIAHTGIALWIDGELRLMHAPLVGERVEISERSLAERILAIGSQDGIMVARPIELSAQTSSPGGGG